MHTKKLKLYGEKDDFKGFIAEIYVKNNKLVVKSPDKKLEKELYNEINKYIESDDFFYIPETIETDLTIGHGFSRHKFVSPRFLEALQCEFWNYTEKMNKFGHKKFYGYKIRGNKSEIVGE